MSRARGTGSLFRKSYKRNGRTYREPTWTIQFYDGQGRRQREATHLRDKQAAQRELNKRLAQVANQEYRRAEPIRVEELYTALRLEYLNDRRTRTAVRLAQQWRDYLGPAFAGRFAASLTTDDTARYAGQRREAGAANASINRELAALRRMLNLGKKAKKVREVPYISMLKENNTRTGFVEDAQFDLLAAEAGELWLRTFLELAYEYGWRRGELLGLRVKHINLALGTIRLDPGTTKNHEGREVAMSTGVRTLLQQCVQGKEPEDYVLTREVKQGKRTVHSRVVDMRHAWQSLCVRAGQGRRVCAACGSTVTAKKCEQCGSRKNDYRGLIPHDLRRSAAKALRRAGVAESVIMETGGWKTAAMFRRYAIKSSADQRAAVEMRERERQRARAEALPNSPANGPAALPLPAKLQ
jgi:integrase